MIYTVIYPMIYHVIYPVIYHVIYPVKYPVIYPVIYDMIYHRIYHRINPDISCEYQTVIYILEEVLEMQSHLKMPSDQNGSSYIELKPYPTVYDACGVK